MVYAYDVVLLLFIPCFSASRVRLAADKGTSNDEGLFVPRIPGLMRPAVESPQAMATWKQSDLRAPLRLQAVASPGEPPFGGPDPSRANMHTMRQLLEASWRSDNDYDITANGFQVYTDLDDTLWSSGGGKGSIDESFYNHESYPGAYQFVLELSRGPQEYPNPSAVIPLLASPEEIRAFLTVKENSHVVLDCKRVGQVNGFHTWGLDMHEAYGRVMDFAYEAVELQKQHTTNARSSLLNLAVTGMSKHWKRKYHQLKNDLTGKPQVFVGHNGESLSSERIAFEGGDRLQALFIHDVRHDAISYYDGRSGPDKIHYFDTYWDAATKALELGFISEAGMKRVQEAFMNANVVKLCMNQHLFTDGRYPCIDTIGGNRLLDAVTLEPLPAELKLDTVDGTAAFTECMSTMVGGIRKLIPSVPHRLIRPSADGSRCDSIARVMNSRISYA